MVQGRVCRAGTLRLALFASNRVFSFCYAMAHVLCHPGAAARTMPGINLREQLLCEVRKVIVPDVGRLTLDDKAQTAARAGGGQAVRF